MRERKKSCRKEKKKNMREAAGVARCSGSVNDTEKEERKVTPRQKEEAVV